MSHVYSPTGAGTYVFAYTMPDDGDPRNASAFNVPMEGLAEDLKRVKNSLDFGSVDYAATRTFEFLLSNDPTYWDRVIDGFFNNQSYWSQQAHASSRILQAPLDLPQGFIIDSVQVWLDPLTGRPGLPVGGDAASIELMYTEILVGPSVNGVSLGSQSDPSATLAAYEQLHAITLTLGTPHTVSRSNRTYSLAFRNETGVNAQNFSRVYMAVVSGTMQRVY